MHPPREMAKLKCDHSSPTKTGSKVFTARSPHDLRRSNWKCMSRSSENRWPVIAACPKPGLDFGTEHFCKAASSPISDFSFKTELGAIRRSARYLNFVVAESAELWFGNQPFMRRLILVRRHSLWSRM